MHVDVIGPNGGYTLACDAVADDTGAWACEVTLSSDPALAVGEYNFTATGLTSGNVETGTFTDAAGNYSKPYAHWSDEPLPGDWNNNILIVFFLIPLPCVLVPPPWPRLSQQSMSIQCCRFPML